MLESITASCSAVGGAATGTRFASGAATISATIFAPAILNIAGTSATLGSACSSVRRPCLTAPGSPISIANGIHTPAACS